MGTQHCMQTIALNGYDYLVGFHPTFVVRNSSHSTSGLQGWIYSTWEYCSNENSFASITVNAECPFVWLMIT